jgi:hypothetical protein
MHVFTSNPHLADSESLRLKTEVAIRRFYKNHILPFAAFPAVERPELAMLVASYRSACKRIFVSEMTTVRMLQQGWAAVGAGQFFADTLMSQLWAVPSKNTGSPIDLRIAQLMAVYVLFRVKEFISGCGKRTTLTVLPNQRHFSPDQILQLETLFRKQSIVESEVISHIFRRGNLEADTLEVVAAKTEALRDECDRIVRQRD